MMAGFRYGEPACNAAVSVFPFPAGAGLLSLLKRGVDIERSRGRAPAVLFSPEMTAIGTVMPAWYPPARFVALLALISWILHNFRKQAFIARK